MKRLVIVSSIFVLLSAWCPARLGETLEQCAERYGPQIEKRRALVSQSDADAAVFSKNGVTVIAELQKGTTWLMTFRKAKLSSAEVDALLAANAVAAGWSKPLRYGDREYRISPDKKRVAVTTFGTANEVTQLQVMLREYSEKLQLDVLSRAAQSGVDKTTEGNKANPLPGF